MSGTSVALETRRECSPLNLLKSSRIYRKKKSLKPRYRLKCLFKKCLFIINYINQSKVTSSYPQLRSLTPLTHQKITALWVQEMPEPEVTLSCLSEKSGENYDWFSRAWREVNESILLYLPPLSVTARPWFYPRVQSLKTLASDRCQ